MFDLNELHASVSHQYFLISELRCFKTYRFINHNLYYVQQSYSRTLVYFTSCQNLKRKQYKDFQRLLRL